MAEIALAVIGLFPVCMEGFKLIEEAVHASDTLQQQFGRVTLQIGVFQAWGEYWGLEEEFKPKLEARQLSTLEVYLQSGTKVGPSVLRALAEIATTFTNIASLKKYYGVELKSEKDMKYEDIDISSIVRGNNRTETVSEQSRRMGLMKRAKFVLKDKKGLERLVTQIAEYLDALLKMCSEQTAKDVERSMLNKVLTRRTNSNDLYSVAEAARRESQSKKSNSESHTIHDFIAIAADFKIQVQESKSKKRDPRIFPTEHLSVRSGFKDASKAWEVNNGQGTMALARDVRQVHYVEWKVYESDNENQNAEDNDAILELATILSSTSDSTNSAILPCNGIFEDPANQRYGFVYELPHHIANLPDNINPPQGTISVLRKPVTLLSLLDNAYQSTSPPSEDLSVRFQIAKQLVHSLYLLHAGGLVHKKSESVIFFPAKSRDGGPSRSNLKDMLKPWLVGFGYSRGGMAHEEIRVRNPKQHLTTPEYRFLDGREYHSNRSIDHSFPLDSVNTGRGYPSIKVHRTPRYACTTPNVAILRRINLDIYHHPDKRTDPYVRYAPSDDIYSLGCVLLEIGLWRSLGSLCTTDAPGAVHQELLRSADKLVGYTGSRYSTIVKNCLGISGRLRDWEATQDFLCWNVAAPLDRCSV